MEGKDNEGILCLKLHYHPLEHTTTCAPHCYTQPWELNTLSPVEASQSLLQRQLEIGDQLIQLVGLLGTNSRRLESLFGEEGETMVGLMKKLYGKFGLTYPPGIK